jgi:hypothetical protein
VVAKEVLIGLAGGSGIPEAREKTAGPALFPERKGHGSPSLRSSGLSSGSQQKTAYTMTIAMRWRVLEE